MVATPTVQAVGTYADTTGSLALTIPSHIAGDVLLLICECAESAGCTAPSGWAHITTSPRAQGSNVTTCNVFWLRATTNSTSNPTVPDPGNHVHGRIVVIRGAVASGNPWDFTPVGDGSSGTVFSADGGTTTGTNRLVLVAIAGGFDTLTDQFTSVVNATLSSFTEQFQDWTDMGNGGGIALYSGNKTTAGASGDTSGDITNSTSWSSITLAIIPLSVTGTLAATLDNATMVAAGSETIPGTLAATLAGATMVAAGSETITGTLAATLAGATMVAAGSETIPGILAATLAGATIVAAGSETIPGTLTATLAGATMVAAGSETIPGTLTATLGGATLAASGTEIFTGTLAAALDGATFVGGGSETITGTLAATLDNATMVATGSSQSGSTGTLVAILEGATMVAVGFVHIVAPPERTLTIPPEDRLYRVAAENRRIVIPPEDRTLVIGAP